MHYQVAFLSVQLQGLPQECTSAYISVASPASGLAFGGTTEGTQSARVLLTSVLDASLSVHVATVPGGFPSGKTLSTTPPSYLFPTTAPTNFTIAYNDAEGEQYASATFQAPLKADTPYPLNGTYSDGSILLSGIVTPSE